MKKTNMKKVIAAVLASTMVMASNLMTFAAVAPEAAAPDINVGALVDGKVEVTINVDGSVDAFDYGIAYDNTKASYASVKVNPDFNSFYSECDGILAKGDKGAYYVFGGTCAKADGTSATYKGDIIVVTFTVTDATAQFAVVTKSAKFETTYSEALTLTSAVSKAGAELVGITPIVTPGPVTDAPTAAPTTDAPTVAPTAVTSTAPVVTATATTAVKATATAATTTTAATATATAATTATSTTSTSAKTGDTANTVLPIIAICAAAAVVVVASKKKVQE